MRANDSFVDLRNTITVEQSLVAERVVENKKGRKARHTFVAVQFINSDQMPLWTNYSKDGGPSWLQKDFELSAAEKPRREGVVFRAPYDSSVADGYKPTDGDIGRCRFHSFALSGFASGAGSDVRAGVPMGRLARIRYERTGLSRG